MIKIICRLIVFPVEIHFYFRMILSYAKAFCIRPDMINIWRENMIDDMIDFFEDAFKFRKRIDIFKNYKTYEFGLTGRYTDYLYKGIEGAF